MALHCDNVGPDLGVLACLGWPRRKLFGVVLSEVGVIGLVAGLLSATGLAVLLAVLASVVPAMLAQRLPLAAVLARG
ncbi:hypothetical protein ACQP25_25425 [Microtetraspora malaysiensis]|uniref:hypothetical protein n=1 Tax=Microtetraspora malaysiensis TaxID=161358 RepID=UPI003D8C5416